MRKNNKLDVKDRVLADTANAASVAIVTVSVQSRLWSIWLVKDVDNILGGGVAAKVLNRASELAESLLDLLDGWRRALLELDAEALSVAIDNGDTVAGGRDLELLFGDNVEGDAVGSNVGKNLAGLPLELIFLAANVGNQVVKDIHGGNAGGKARTGNGLHGGNNHGGDGTKLFLESLERDNHTGSGAVGDAHFEALLLLLEVGANVQMLGVAGRDDKRNILGASVVFGVGDDDEASIDKGLLNVASVVGVETREDNVALLEVFRGALLDDNASDLLGK